MKFKFLLFLLPFLLISSTLLAQDIVFSDCGVDNITFVKSGTDVNGRAVYASGLLDGLTISEHLIYSTTDGAWEIIENGILIWKNVSTAISPPPVGTGTWQTFYTGCGNNNLTLAGAVVSLAIIGQPSNSTICAGANTTFSVSASNATGYQWQVNQGSGFNNISNGAPYSGATTATLTITGAGTTLTGYQYRCLVTGTGGSTTSNSATLTVNPAPSFTAQPSASTVCAGANTTFTVTASNATGYQWQVDQGAGFNSISNSALYSGATTGTLTITGATAGLNGYIYRCIATGNCTPNATSNSAALTINSAPAIITQPSASTICAGANTIFFVVAFNATGYQWQVDQGMGFSNISDGALYSGTTSNTLVIIGATAGLNGYIYRCVATGSCTPNATSNSAALTINSAPAITAQPSASTICAGANTTFTVTASNATGYQWQVDQGAGFNSISNSALYSGATTATLTITGATAGLSGYIYRCVATGTCTPNATSNAAALTINSAPAITAQPLANTICAGANTTFSVTASNATGYQWQVDQGAGFNSISNSALYSGATTATLTITGATAGLSGYIYRCVATGTCTPNATSNTAALIINSAPAITAQPSASTISVGANTTFSVTASNATGYQWQVDQGAGFSNVANVAPYSGANSATLTITGATAGLNGYIYRCVAAGSCAPAAVSSSAALTVSTPLSAYLSMQTNIACNGQSSGAAGVSAVGGRAPYSYSWSPSGGTNSSAAGLSAGTYTVTVTDADNNTVTLTDIQISQPTPLQATITKTDASYGNFDGTATVTASGGTPAYTYWWSPSGGTDATATRLAPGTYDVTITDANACSIIQTVTIGQLAAPPSVTSVSVPANGTYATGTMLDFAVSFSDNVTVTGTPQIGLTIGSANKQASYISGSGTSSLVFSYTVANGDVDADGITVGALALNGGTIKNGTTDAVLTLNSVGSTAGVNVDGVAPTVTSIAATTPANTNPTNATSLTYTVTFSKAVSGVDVSDFTLTSTGTSAGAVSSIAGSGTTYTVTVSSVSGNGTLRLDLNTSGTGITDAIGNAISGGFTTGNVYTIDNTTPLLQAGSYYTNNGNSSQYGKVGDMVTLFVGFNEPLQANPVVTLGGNTVTAIGSNNNKNWTATYTLTSSDVEGQFAFDVQGADIAGNTIENTSAQYGAYISFDKTAPSVTIGSPSVSTIAAGSGSVTYTVNYSDTYFNASTLSASDITLNSTGTANGSLSLSGSGTTYTVTISGITGVGSLGFSIRTGTASDIAGNTTGPATSTNFAVTPAIVPQTITFNTLTAKTYGDADFDPGATSDNSGTGITYASSNTSVATITAGNKIHIIGAGAAIITASQAADATHTAAVNVQQSLTVYPKSLTVTLNGTPTISKTYDGNNVATLTPGRYILNGIVGSDIVTVSGTASYNNANAATGKAVTVNNLTLAGAQHDNYTLLTVSASTTGSINARPVTVTADAQTKVYGDADPALTYQATGLLGTDVLTGTLTRVTGENAGTFIIDQGALSVPNSNYTISSFTGANLTITPATATLALSNLSQVYDGTAKPVTVTSTPPGLSGITVTYNGSSTVPTAVGSYTVTAHLANINYTAADATGTLNVTAAASTITFNSLGNKTYGDADFDPAAASDNTATGITYASSNTAVATIVAGKIHIVGAGSTNITASQAADANHSAPLNVQQSLTVDPKSLTLTLNSTPTISKIYDGNNTATLAAGNYILNGIVGSDIVTVSGTAGYNNANAGTGKTVTVNNFTLAGAQRSNYTLTTASATTTGSVGAKPIAVAADAQSKTYGSADPALTYSYTGALVGSDSFSGSLTRATGENVNSYAINQGSLALSNNYTLNYTGASFTIGKKTIAVTANAQSKTYGDADPALTYGFSPALITGDSFGGSLTRATGENAGTYAINQGSLTLSNNYTLNYTGASLIIGKKTINVMANAQSKTYGDADPSLTYDFSPALVTGDNFNGLLTRATGESVGTYAINQGSLVLSNNYTLNYTHADLTIGKAPLTITANDQTKLYGSAVPVLTASYSGFVGSDNKTSLTTQPALSTSATAASPVGNYAIAVSNAAADNYIISYVPGNLSVTADQPVISFVSIPVKTYGDADFALGATSNNTVTAITYSSDNTAVATIVNDHIHIIGAGSVNITASQVADANHMAAASVTRQLTINKAAVSITANAQSKTYGQSDPTLTYNITSGALVGTDSFTGELSRTAGENAGTYAVAQGTLSLSSNYTVNYSGANLTIDKAALTITANDQTKVYGAALPTLTVSYNGFVGSDNASSLTTQPVVSTPATAASPVNTYPITVSGAASANYTINYTPGTLTVTGTTNANLSNLTTNTGTLSPAFAQGTTAYTVAVAYPVTSIKVTPTVADPNASVKVNGATVASGSASTAINLAVGINTITVKVTAQDGSTTNTYTISVNRAAPSADATLASLTLSNGGSLSPAFAPSTTGYTTNADNMTSYLSIIPTAASANATITVNGSPVSSGLSSSVIDLTTGGNLITIVVTAQDGVTRQTYTVSVNRAPATLTTASATNILSPNGDGKNDVWVIKDIQLFPNNTVTVYDRAGRIVFKQKNYGNDWDGTFQGAPLAEDTYYYVIEPGSGLAPVKGFITIVRRRN